MIKNNTTAVSDVHSGAAVLLIGGYSFGITGLWQIIGDTVRSDIFG